MIIYFRRILSNTLWYASSQVLTRAIGFLLIPVYTRVLTPDDYGTVALINTVTSIFTIICDLGLRGAVGTFYYDYYKDEKAVRIYIGSVLLFLLPYGTILVLLGILIGKGFLQPLLGPVPFYPFLPMALGIGFFQVIFTLLQSLYQVQEKSRSYALLTTLSFVVNLGLIIYFVVYQHQGAVGNTKAQFISSLVFFIVSIFLLRRYLLVKLDFQKLRASLRFGLPLVPHMLSGWIMSAVDRIFLSHYSGLTVLGVYSLGYKLGDIMSIVTNSINLAWVPFFMSTAKEKGEDAKPILSHLITYYLAALCLLGLILSVPAREIVMLLSTEGYYSAFIVVPIIVFGNVFGGMYYMVVNQIFFSKKTKYLPLATFSAGFLQVFLNYLWVPRFGMIGSAWAMFAAQLWSFGFTWALSFKVYPMHLEYLRLLRIIVVTGVILAAGMWINFYSFWLNVLVKGLVMCSYPLILYFTGFFRRDELALFNKFRSRILNRLSIGTNS